MKNLAAKILSYMLIFALALSICGCAENADTLQIEDDSLDYNEIMQGIEDYQIAYSTYREENGDDVSVLSDGYTTDEIPCTVHYLESDNGKYKIASVEASRSIMDNAEVPVYDTYYLIADNELFITRGYVDPSGLFMLSQYVVYDGVLYSIDTEKAELNRETKADSFDFYLAFDEITSLYGEN